MSVCLNFSPFVHWLIELIFFFKDSCNLLAFIINVHRLTVVLHRPASEHLISHTVLLGVEDFHSQYFFSQQTIPQSGDQLICPLRRSCIRLTC